MNKALYDNLSYYWLLDYYKLTDSDKEYTVYAISAIEEETSSQ